MSKNALKRSRKTVAQHEQAMDQFASAVARLLYEARQLNEAGEPKAATALMAAAWPLAMQVAHRRFMTTCPTADLTANDTGRVVRSLGHHTRLDGARYEEVREAHALVSLGPINAAEVTTILDIAKWIVGPVASNVTEDKPDAAPTNRIIRWATAAAGSLVLTDQRR